MPHLVYACARQYFCNLKSHELRLAALAAGTLSDRLKRPAWKRCTVAVRTTRRSSLPFCSAGGMTSVSSALPWCSCNAVRAEADPPRLQRGRDDLRVVRTAAARVPWLGNYLVTADAQPHARLFRAFRQPLTRQLLGCGDLFFGHSCGENVFVCLGILIALRSCQIEPLICLDRILSHALASGIHEP